MKTYNHLYDEICSFENLWLAARKAQKGKRFKTNVGCFNANLEKELICLREALISRTYLPGPYKAFYIYEPKKRMISAAPYRDRVVHHALCNVIVPLFERGFITDSYANRVGKGTHKGVLRFQHFLRKHDYVLKCDVQKYFPSIDHKILKGLLRRRIRCARTLRLADTIIDHSNPQEPVVMYFEGDDLLTPLKRRRGLPIGNLTSQFFANVVLNPLDHFVKEVLRCKGYVRYVDDLAVFHSDKAFLHEVWEQIAAFLKTLRLRLHPHKCRIFPAPQGVDFLGYRVFRDHRLLRRDNVIRAGRRLRRLAKAYSEGRIIWETVDRSVQSWIGHAGFADTWGVRRKLFSEVFFVKGSSRKTEPCVAGRFVEQ